MQSGGGCSFVDTQSERHEGSYKLSAAIRGLHQIGVQVGCVHFSALENQISFRQADQIHRNFNRQDGQKEFAAGFKEPANACFPTAYNLSVTRKQSLPASRL